MIGPLLATFVMIATIKVAMDVAWADPFGDPNPDDVVSIILVGSVLSATVLLIY